MKVILVDKQTRRQMKVGDTLTTFRGERCTLMGWKEPYNPEDNLVVGGKIYVQIKGVQHQDQFYPTVCGLEFALQNETEQPMVPLGFASLNSKTGKTTIRTKVDGISAKAWNDAAERSW